MSYAFDDALPVDAPAEVPDGTNVLVSGPPLVGKRELALRLLAVGHRHGEGAIAVTTDAPSEQLLGEYRDAAGEGAGRALRAIDACGESRRESPNVEYVASPADLTGIGMSYSRAVDSLRGEGTDRVRVGFDSVSTMLQYLDSEDLYKFLHVMTSRIGSTGYLGVFTVDDSGADTQTMGMIKNAFDGMLQVREGEAGRREVRTVGLAGDRDWRAV